MRRIRILLVATIVSFFMMGVTPVVTSPVVNAQGNQNIICTIFPFLSTISFGASSICGSVQEGASEAIGFVRFLLSLIFVAIIIISIYVVIRAAIKYIQSEGDDKKIAEAQKAIKSVFLGIAALFVGIIGIVIVLAFFNASNTVNTNNLPPSVNNILNGLK